MSASLDLQTFTIVGVEAAIVLVSLSAHVPSEP